MGEKIATRAAYGKALVELADKYPDLMVFDADLSSATMTKDFAKAYPDRFFDMGIAECNMVGVAAGMATCGLKPFVNTFAMFASGRAWEQVRNSVAYPHLNVKVIGSHGGLSVGEDGATHQCIEDFALMRAIPGMVVLCPKSPEDIIQEGQALHHCVGTYVDRVAKQECVILFLRRAAEADKPFYTLEIRNRKVVQARSANNRPATPKVQRFLDQWEREVLQAA